GDRCATHARGRRGVGHAHFRGQRALGARSPACVRKTATMKAILLPVKLFAKSKTRLAQYFSQAERAALAAALCEDLFDVVAKVSGVDRVIVVSAEAHALALAQQRGWGTIAETDPICESYSVDAASRECAARGVTSLLR